MSLGDYEANNKINSHKGTNAAAEREKEDKAILSTLPIATVKHLDGYESQIGEAEPLPNSYVRFMERSGEELDGKARMKVWVKILLYSASLIQFSFVRK